MLAIHRPVPCPHCQSIAHLTLRSTPEAIDLSHREHLLFECPSCHTDVTDQTATQLWAAALSR